MNTNGFPTYTVFFYDVRFQINLSALGLFNDTLYIF